LVLSSIEAALAAEPQISLLTEADDASSDGSGSEDNAKPVDSRNKLNDLNGKEWIQETKSIWRQRGLGANHAHTRYERLHPAPFSFQDVARLIRLFTKRGMLVLDPFVGVGSTLKAAALETRRGIGIELSPKWAEIARMRLNEEVPGHQGQQIWCMDVRDALSKLPDAGVDFIVTSPPYWTILNKKPDHKTLQVRIANGLDQCYSNDPRDLANIPSYEQFLVTLADVFRGLSGKLRPGAYCAIIVSDFKHGTRFYPYHADLAAAIGQDRLALEGITILEQRHKALYPYGYPYAYVPNVHHQYILILRRPNGERRKNGNGRPGRAVQEPIDTYSAVRRLATLPYKEKPFASRHWGHGRHSLCSFPSKMKPALAATLIDLFTPKSGVILDPFSGCGTIPFEAALRGRAAVGTDLSPLAFVLTHAKLNYPDRPELDVLMEDLARALSRPSRHSDSLLDEMDEEIQAFYHTRTAVEIVVTRRHLGNVSKNFTSGSAPLFVTACLAHIMHGNRPYALSRRSHNIIPIPPKGPRVYKSVLTSLKEKCERMLAIPLPSAFRPGTSLRCPASNLPLDDGFVDAVVTSPPFLGSTEFLRQNRLRHWLVGWDYRRQIAEKGKFLEHAKDIEGYRPISRELYRVVAPGGIVALHLGIVKRVNMADLLSPLFGEVGFEEVGRVWEDVSHLETHGRTDRGGTHTHGVVVWRKSAR
jgi:DNA modification methylase